MVRVSTVVPSELTSEITRSLRISGKRSSLCVPLTLHEVVPTLVSHVKTAGWFRKTVVLSGGRRISGEMKHKLLFMTEVLSLGHHWHLLTIAANYIWLLGDSKTIARIKYYLVQNSGLQLVEAAPEFHLQL